MDTNTPQDLLGTAAPATAAWPKMDLSLLDEQHGAPPPFPLDVLPPFWRTWTEAATASTGAPADYVALSLLTAAGSLVAHRRVMPAPGWAEPCILWTALVGPPSCGKTPALEAACRLLGAVWHQRQLGPKNPHGSVVPTPLFTNATTIDVLLGVLRETQPRGVLLVRDEHGGWLSHMARGTRDGSAHAFWLSTWCRRNLDLGWRGKTVDFDSPSVSILGTMHPDALLPALGRDDGGVLARFLFVRPVPSADWQPPSGADALPPGAVAALRRLYEQRWQLDCLPLAGEAHAAFNRFRRAHHVPMADLAGKAAAWWGKGPSQVLRLAGVLTFLDWAAQPAGTAEPQQVPAWAVEAAVRLWRDYLWPHAQATLRIAGAGGERESHQRQVLRWLAQQGLPEVSREHIRREALQQALDAAGTDRLINDLVEGGWLQPVEPPTGRRGRRRRRWHVHDGLWMASGARPLEARPPEARPPGARQHPELVEGSSGASPEAQAQGDLLPRNPNDAVPAIPASESNATVAAIGPSPEDRIRSDQGSTAASAAPYAADDYWTDALDVIPAVSATPSDAAMAVAPSSTPAAAPPPSPPDGLPAIRASESATSGPIKLRPVTPADKPVTAEAGGNSGAAPRLSARARRRLRRLQRSAHLRNGVDAAPHATAA